MVWEHHVTVLPANYISVFYMGPTTNTQSYAKCTYMIGWDHASISRVSVHADQLWSFLAFPMLRGILNLALEPD